MPVPDRQQHGDFGRAGGGTGSTNTPLPPAPTSDEPPAGAPSVVPSAAPTDAPVAEAVAMPPTEAVSSELGGRLLPGLLVIGLLGIAVASAVRFFVQPPSGPRP